METRTTGVIGGRYRIEGLLGEGGMARVFDAFDERLERPVAVKVLRDETWALPGMRRRFQQEARLAARLNHPHIVAVLDYGEAHDRSFLVMERLPGTTLRHEIDRGPVALERVILIAAETLSAMEVAHRCGVLHRDVKPNNILLEDNGHTKLSDFGIAKIFDVRSHPDLTSDDLTVTGVVLGTPAYLAPERRSGQPASVQSDVYAVGAVMVEAVTGRRVGPDLLATDEVPGMLRAVAARALAPDPRHRFVSASEMLDALPSRESGAVATTTVPTTPSTVTVPTVPSSPATTQPNALVVRSPASHPLRRRERRRWGLLVGFALAALLGAVLFSVLMLMLVSGGGDAPTGAHASSPHLATSRVSTRQTASIEAMASTLARGRLPGDAALARSLDVVAAQPVGTQRRAAAEKTLTLAQVLLAGSGISAVQYEEVVNVLTPTGAAVPTTTTTTSSTTTTTTIPPPATQAPGHGHHDHHGPGGGPNPGQGGKS